MRMITHVIGAYGIVLASAASFNVAAAEESVLWKAKSPFLKGVQTHPNLEPSIPHPERERAAKRKLQEFGRKPNVLVIFVDDMGWETPVATVAAQQWAPQPRIWTSSLWRA